MLELLATTDLRSFDTDYNLRKADDKYYVYNEYAESEISRIQFRNLKLIKELAENIEKE